MNKAFHFIYAVAITTLAVVLYLSWNSTPKTAYMINVDVYEGFILKKELESKLMNIQERRNSVLDSLELVLQMQEQEIQLNPPKENAAIINEYKALRNKYLLVKEKYTGDNERLRDEYSKQIWKQLNQYIKDFGNEKGYAFIYGAGGSGTIMHAQESYNITDDLLKYVNDKYQGVH